MKKIVLSLAGVMAAAAFAPEASAVPAFARQTGLACNSCHFQHYPVLGTTGQEFRAGAYTQVSAKGKFKGDDLSIPDTLNAAILLKARYQKENGTDRVGTYPGTTTNSGQFQIPDEFSLFFGGRIGDNGTIKMGFLSENSMGGAGTLGGMATGFKLPVAVSLDPVSILVVPYVTDALGMAYGFEQSSTGTTRGIRWAEHRKEISAAQYTGLGDGTASGVAFVVNTEFGYLNLSKWSPQFAYVEGKTGVRMSSTWLRVAATPTIADWAMHIGLGVASGTSSCADPLAEPDGTITGAGLDSNGNPAMVTVQGHTNPASMSHNRANDCETKGTVFDVQAQGALGEMEASFYFQTATAPKSPAIGTGLPNHFNASTANDLKATTIGADVTVVPHTLTVGAAYRKGTLPNATADKDDAITLTAVYDLFQNVAFHANYSKYSGPAYSVAGASNSLLTLMLEAAW